MAVTTIRLDDKDLDGLRNAGRELGMGQSAMLRQALRRGVRELRMDKVLEKYVGGMLPISAAAKNAGVSIWEFLDELKSRGMFVKTDEDVLEEALKELQ